VLVQLQGRRNYTAVKVAPETSGSSWGADATSADGSSCCVTCSSSIRNCMHLTGLPVNAEAAAAAAVAAAAALWRASRLTHDNVDSQLERLLHYSTGFSQRCVS